MKKIFTHENRLIVFNLKNLLQEQGIECIVKNEFSGGGVGDLAPFETWPELWLMDESDTNAAKQVISQLQQDDDEEVKCPHCGEENGRHFRICWQCGESLELNS
jgi:hypothetical protein